MSRTWDLLRQSDWGGTDPEIAALPADIVEAPQSRALGVNNPNGPWADRFRLLRLRLLERWNADQQKVLLVTSPLAGDGKSTVALSLAGALAERGKRTVLLIGADLHHPTLTEELGLTTRSGLAECLEKDIRPLTVIRRIEPMGWYLLPAGKPRGNPTELLQSAAFGEFLRELSRQFEWVVIDAPPAIPLADVLALRQRSSGSLVVVRAGKTPADAVERTIGLLGPKHVLGIVLNGVEHFDRAYSKYYPPYRVEQS